LESVEEEMERRKKKIFGKIRIAKKEKIGKKDTNRMEENVRGDSGL